MVARFYDFLAASKARTRLEKAWGRKLWLGPIDGEHAEALGHNRRINRPKVWHILDLVDEGDNEDPQS